MEIQHDQIIIGTSTSSHATLTENYADNESATFPIGGMHSIVVFTQYTPKTGQSDRILYMQVELGPTENDLYKITKRADISGDDSLVERFIYCERFVGATGGTIYKPRFAIGDIADKFVMVSFKESGISDFGTVFARILYSGK